MELLDEERKLLEYVNDVDHDIEGVGLSPSLSLSLSLSLWKGRLFNPSFSPYRVCEKPRGYCQPKGGTPLKLQR